MLQSIRKALHRVKAICMKSHTAQIAVELRVPRDRGHRDQNMSGSFLHQSCLNGTLFAVAVSGTSDFDFHHRPGSQAGFGVIEVNSDWNALRDLGENAGRIWVGY